MSFYLSIGFLLCFLFLQLTNPKLDLEPHKDLLVAVRLLVSEDECEGRFVFGRQLPKPAKEKSKVSSSKDVGGDLNDNSKNQLQTLLARAGHEPPTYKTKALKNNQFYSTVIFNGLNFKGRPCSNKKLAEKDSAAEALLWLKGESHSPSADFDNATVLLKKSRKRRRTLR